MANPSQRCVLISGGSRGLGAAFVESLLADGHNVATFSRTETPFIAACREQHPERFFWTCLDAQRGQDLRRFVRDVVARFSRLDVLINNAGIADSGVLPMMKDTAIRRMLSVNLEAAILLAQAASRAMLRQRHGLILNISSIVGLRGYAGLAAYSTTKAGMDGLTRSLARELGPAGVRVNSVAPGFLETEMSSELSDEQREQIVRRTPLGRLGTTADVVGLMRFLMSDAASFVTGQVLVVDGGITC